MKIILAGATGFIGQSLIKKLHDQGHSIFVLTRNPKTAEKKLNGLATALAWDGHFLGDWLSEIDGSDAIINLAGEGLAAKRWTNEFKQSCWNSRVNATRVLVQAIRQSKKKPSIFLQSSAVGYYGHLPEGVADESLPPSQDFLGQLCYAWEQSATELSSFGIRTVWFRIGIVLEKDGGALAKMIPLFRFFTGGPLGSGKQFFPWIHREDVVEAFLFALQNPLEGPFNLAAPESMTMKQFSQALGKTLHRPSWLPVPEWALKLAVGEFSTALVSGQNARPDKLTATGFHFKFPELLPALKEILHV